MPKPPHSKTSTVTLVLHMPDEMQTIIKALDDMNLNSLKQAEQVYHLTVYLEDYLAGWRKRQGGGNG